MKNKSWIRDDVIIDFKVPKSIANLMLSLEELDKDEDYGYCNYYDALDDLAKECYIQGALTKEQWDRLLEKYGGYND